MRAEHIRYKSKARRVMLSEVHSFEAVLTQQALVGHCLKAGGCGRNGAKPTLGYRNWVAPVSGISTFRWEGYRFANVDFPYSVTNDNSRSIHTGLGVCAAANRDTADGIRAAVVADEGQRRRSRYAYVCATPFALCAKATGKHTCARMLKGATGP